MIKGNEKGFTLVELLLAMAFFSFILMFITTGFIIINRAYTKGINVKLVQDEGRQLIEDFTRNMRTSSPASISTTPPGDKCMTISGVRYYWSIPINSTDANSPNKLMREEGLGCGDPINTTNPGGVSMLDERVGVQFIDVRLMTGSSSVYSVKIVLSTATTNLVGVAGENAECTIGSGDQYCDIVTFSTLVSTR